MCLSPVFPREQTLHSDIAALNLKGYLEMQAPRTETQAHVIVRQVLLDCTFPPALSSEKKLKQKEKIYSSQCSCESSKRPKKSRGKQDSEDVGGLGLNGPLTYCLQGVSMLTENISNGRQ